jgi:hypothetical protein
MRLLEGRAAILTLRGGGQQTLKLVKDVLNCCGCAAIVVRRGSERRHVVATVGTIM